jgi:rubrerythrin
VSVSRSVASDQQLARVLQVGVVLEELVEARAYEHYRSLADEVDEEIEDLLLEAREESGEHRERLEALIQDLEADSVPYGEIEALVQEKYGRSKPADVDALLRDQLTSEETAYTYYDGVIAAIQAGDAEFSIDRDRLLSTLRDIQAEEAEGAEEVSEVIERQ